MQTPRATERPTTAGPATLVYSLQPGQLPTADREQAIIHLPEDLSWTVAILGGAAHLFDLPGTRAQYMAGYDGTGVYASPLARHIKLQSMVTAEAEQAFLNSLRPSKLVAYTQQFKLQMVRQGDFWVAPVATDGPGLGHWLSHLQRHDFGRYVAREVSNRPLFGTRHTMTGIRYTPRRPRHAGLQLRGQWVEAFEGTLSAPDHDPIVVNRPHIAIITDAFLRTRDGGVIGD